MITIFWSPSIQLWLKKNLFSMIEIYWWLLKSFMCSFVDCFVHNVLNKVWTIMRDSKSLKNLLCLKRKKKTCFVKIILKLKWIGCFSFRFENIKHSSNHEVLCWLQLLFPEWHLKCQILSSSINFLIVLMFLLFKIFQTSFQSYVQCWCMNFWST